MGEYIERERETNLIRQPIIFEKPQGPSEEEVLNSALKNDCGDVPPPEGATTFKGEGNNNDAALRSKILYALLNTVTRGLPVTMIYYGVSKRPPMTSNHMQTHMIAITERICRKV